MPKRRRQQDVGEEAEDTRRKTRRSVRNAEETEAVQAVASPAETPSNRRSILKGTPKKHDRSVDPEPTPTSLRKVLFSTPAKATGMMPTKTKGTLATVSNDRSARRKSARTLQEKTASDELIDAEDDPQDEALAHDILAGEEADDMDDDLAKPSSAPDTPSKSPKKRGRPKGSKPAKSPSPPPDLPPHELYFFQNRTGGNKTSSNTLPSHLLLNHEDYHVQISAYRDPHEADIQQLKAYHHRAFDQWIFELDQGFNICLYGYGSKRGLVMEFAEHLYDQAEEAPKIVVVNGYTPGLSLRDILITLAGQILPKNAKLHAQPAALLDMLLATIDDPPHSSRIALILHSLDHPNLRKTSTQQLLARLASHNSISVVATCDTPNFPLLWDLQTSRQFRWLYHDATTFSPYTVEIDPVEEVNALLGRSGRRLGGRDGVGYVLKSLPENARNLFRILVAEQLSLADVELDAGAGAARTDLSDDEMLGVEDDEDAAMAHTPSRSRRGRPPKKPKATAQKARPAVNIAPEGVEYRTLYHKAVEDFVCSSELNFRTLLKEFHDHQMIESRKDSIGTERLIVPFRREELEAILEELL